MVDRYKSKAEVLSVNPRRFDMERDCDCGGFGMFGRCACQCHEVSLIF